MSACVHVYVLFCVKVVDAFLAAVRILPHVRDADVQILPDSAWPTVQHEPWARKGCWCVRLILCACTLVSCWFVREAMMRWWICVNRVFLINDTVWGKNRLLCNCNKGSARRLLAVEQAWRNTCKQLTVWLLVFQWRYSTCLRFDGIRLCHFARAPSRAPFVSKKH
jgi:hypothetical protein